MVIIRDHSYLFVCLAVACGGTLGSPSARFSDPARTATAATPDSPGQGDVVRTNKVVLFGRSGASPGASVTAATFDSRMVRRTCNAVLASDRTWSCTQTLADGGYTWTAQVASGGPVSSQIDFIVNTNGSPAPTIDHTPSPTNDARPVLTGTVSSSLVNKGFYLEVTENGTAICIVDPIRSTNWACPLSQKLPDGPHVLTTDVDFHDGDEATPWGNPNAFVVKTSIGRPTLLPIPSPTNLTDILFSGTGEPDATLTLISGSQTLCLVAVTPAGRWSCMPAQSLGDGSHTVSATQQDAAGNTSGAVSATFVIDTHVPRAPTLDKPDTPTADPHVTFNGTGEAGARVSVLDSYSRLLCSALVGAGGAWNCAPASGVADGDYLLIALQATPVGKVSGPSEAAPLSVRTLGVPVFDVVGSPTRESSPLLSGHAQASDNVSVYLGETVICSTQADAGGGWSCRPAPLDDGAYLFQARVSDALSHASGPSVARAVLIDTTPPAAPVLEHPGSPTRKHQPMLSGHAEAGSSVKVMDAATGEMICQDTASAAGAFGCSPAAAIPAGEHHVTASATDQAGNTSLPAAAVSIIISDTVPPPPSIDSPADGTELEQRRPVIQGRTLAGTLVEVSVDGTVFAAQVAGNGQWTLLPPADLSLGAHVISASAVDSAQNVSDPAASRFGIVETGVARGGCASGGLPAPLLAVVALLLAAARKRRALSILGALAVATAPGLAEAQEIDVSLFKPAAGGDGLAAVEGARPPIAGEPRLELRTWTDYAVRPLTFVSSSGQEQALVRGRVAQWLGVQVHLLGPLSVAAQIPLTLAERGDLSGLPPSSRGPSQLLSGFADVRLTPRLSLLRQEWAGIDLATQLSFEFPTARAQSLASDGSVRAEGLVALGRSLGAVPAGTLELLANAYLRLRPARDFLDVKSGTEAGLRAGLEYGIDRVRAWVPRRVYAELEGRSFLRAGFAAGSAPAEWRLGGTVCPVGNLAVDLAGGGALTNGVGAPRARFLFGFGWSPAACGRRIDAQLAASTPAPHPVALPAEPPPTPKAVAEALPLPPPPMVVDRDGDGIPDADDACPDHAGTVENHGCPPGIRQRVIVSATSLEILDRVHFATGQARIEKRSYSLLDQVAAVIQSHPHLLLIQVEGHTDDRGGAAYNILLSQARAAAVTDYLASKGVDRARLVAKGYGPTHPVDSNGTATGRAANRRVAFTVVKTEARVIDAERPPDS